MKKLALIVLALALTLSLASCGKKDETKDTGNAATGEKTTTTASDADTTTTAPTTDSAVPGDATVGSTLKADFMTRAESAASAKDIADGLLTNSIIAFKGSADAVEPGLLAGFGNVEIKGFTEGAKIAPMIGTIPFVGYVFKTDSVASADELITLLKDNADPRWNICTEAEEIVDAKSGDYVFFLMCPKSLEE